jgi:hypothetical protein
LADVVAIATEVEDIANLVSSDGKVVEELGFVFGRYGTDSFQLKDDLVVDDHIRFEVADVVAFVCHGQRVLLINIQAGGTKFDDEGVLVDGLQQTFGKVAVYLKEGAKDLMGLFRVE